jgi:stress-induced morphogen
MSHEALKQKVKDVLKRGRFRDIDDLVDVSNGCDDNVHVVVVSRKFDGLRMKEKEDLIWSELTQHLTQEEWEHVTLSIGVSPEELKAV